MPTKEKHFEEYSALATLPLRDVVVYPHMVLPLFVGRPKSIAALEAAMANDDPVFLLAQIDPNTEDPTASDLHRTGTVAQVLQVLKLPDGTVKVLVEGIRRGRVLTIEESGGLFLSHVEAVDEYADADNPDIEAIRRTLLTQFDQYAKLNKKIPAEIINTINGIDDNSRLVDTIAAHLQLKLEQRQQILETFGIIGRMEFLLAQLESELDIMQVEKRIRGRVKRQMEKSQREYYLNEQVKAIQKELGEEDERGELDALEAKIKEAGMTKEAEEKCLSELKKLKMMPPMSAESTVVRNYIDTLLELPWKKKSRVSKDIAKADLVLNADHYGLEKVKERILEYLAVQKRMDKLKGPILCLVGPPGVGKTSLGESIAKATGRQYVRMALGGVRDESEIRGHRRTYIGSMPGKILQNMAKAGVKNPLFLLDEIDKLGSDFRGDPASALLEVLDPEQNSTFHDNYLDIDYDLSKILFIATANELNTIPAPLLDRMEIIDVSGYITEEKIEIAKRHLIPKELINTGLDKVKPKVRFNKATLEKIIESYTRESGVRQLEKQINKALRKIAFNKAVEDSFPQKAITPSEVTTLLGKPPYYRDIYQGNEYAGIVTGLAWTSVGGEILFIETSLSKGAAGKLTLTGNLGDVMKESAIIALQYVKAHCENLGIDYRIFENYNIHIHVPEGATPKDGPSAGITIATSIASALTQRKVRKNTAMTGEITLRGKVLPVGGIKEKILAAKRAGITDILMCKDNRKDIDEIPEKYLQGVTFHYVENIQDVWNFALTDEIVSHPVHYTIDKKEDKVQ